MFDLFRKKKRLFFPAEEQEKILACIRAAEMQTSGEIRVYIESKCRFVEPLDRAKEIFALLKMDQTAQRNAVIVYIAMEHRQLAVYADEGIYQKTGAAFWNDAIRLILSEFDHAAYANGIAAIVQKIGAALAQHFPYDASTDKNELPDEIVFGK